MITFTTSTLHRFRGNDTNTSVNWQEFPDYDTIFTDVATKTDNNDHINKEQEYHTMTMNDMHEINGFNNDDLTFRQRNSLTPSTPSFISSRFPTPPPLPIIDNNSPQNNKLNDDFWSNLIDAASPCMSIILSLCSFNP